MMVVTDEKSADSSHKTKDIILPQRHQPQVHNSYISHNAFQTKLIIYLLACTVWTLVYRQKHQIYPNETMQNVKSPNADSSFSNFSLTFYYKLFSFWSWFNVNWKIKWKLLPFLQFSPHWLKFKLTYRTNIMRKESE